MCGIPCLMDKWQPPLIPTYRPPIGGWTINMMPAIFPDNLRRLWSERAAKSNRNGHEAVVEMATFLQFNKQTIGPEQVAAIREQAEAEWCAREPSRCPRRSVKLGKASASTSPPEIRIVQATPMPPRQHPVKPRSGCSSCGGGRKR